MTPTQVVFIHGGMTFKTKKDYLHWLKTRKISLESKKRWQNEYLSKNLGERFDIIKLRMPCFENASYEEWKIHFERYLPYLRDNLILIGRSLGGIFFAKYLSEHKFPKKVLSTYLVCPPFDNTLPGEDVVNGFTLKKDLSLLQKNTKNLYVLFSEDDDVVPVAHAQKFRKKLPLSTIIVYKSKNGHFQVSSFPEIVKLIKSDVKKK